MYYDYASTSNPGFVKLWEGSQDYNDYAEYGLRLSASSNVAYVRVPVASKDNLGLLKTCDYPHNTSYNAEALSCNVMLSDNFGVVEVPAASN